MFASMAKLLVLVSIWSSQALRDLHQSAVNEKVGVEEMFLDAIIKDVKIDDENSNRKYVGVNVQAQTEEISIGDVKIPPPLSHQPKSSAALVERHDNLREAVPGDPPAKDDGGLACTQGSIGNNLGLHSCANAKDNTHEHFGKMCSKIKLGSIAIQGCDSNLCATIGNPKACCKMAVTNQQMICSPQDFPELITEKDFENCETPCNLLGGPTHQDDGGLACTTETLGMKAGVVSCAIEADDTHKVFGKMCQKSKLPSDGSDLLMQGCDSNICATIGNPKTCCKMPHTKQQIICSATDFPASITEKDFENCETPCNLANSGAQNMQALSLLSLAATAAGITLTFF